MGQEECPYKGVVGKTALAFDTSVIVFSVVDDIHDSMHVRVIQSLCTQPLLFQRHVTLWFLSC